VKYNCYPTHLTPEKAISTFEQYDVVLDCTDHPTSRYLISDACVLAGKPLVSAAALKSDGQLIVLNHPARPPGDPLGGPCYRCIFPKPPPAETVVSCGEGGVLGPVVGVMGVLQALEAIKVLTNQVAPAEGPPKATLLLFAAFSRPQFRSLRMRSRSSACAACSATATVQRQSLDSGSLDYLTFCGMTTPLDILPPEHRVKAGEFAESYNSGNVSLIDVRDETQFGICALPGSTNVPWSGRPDAWLTQAKEAGLLGTDSAECFVICRYGNDSQIVVRKILEQNDVKVNAKDIAGGFKSWREEVDKDWPAY
jgi:adenylyltransferase/sulfurtransferase